MDVDEATNVPLVQFSDPNLPQSEDNYDKIIDNGDGDPSYSDKRTATQDEGNVSEGTAKL